MADINSDNHDFKYKSMADPTIMMRVFRVYPAESTYDIVEGHFEEIEVANSDKTYLVHEPIDSEDAERSHVIICNGSLHYLSYHTHFLLKTLRSQEDEKLRCVWSPRLCINQEDADEVAAQQKLLPLIYQEAFQRLSLAPSYKYSPLTSTDSIRLIELDPPSHPSGLVKIKLREVSLADNPEYYYLDIREGLTEDSWPVKGPLICNTRLLSLAKPLYDILQMIFAKVPGSLWVEAVCVNGKNPEEVAHHDALTDSLLRQKAKDTIWIHQPKFTYSPLPESSPHIRLIKLLPASDSTDVLVADIGHFPLDACPEFTALSYVWGPTEPAWMVCMRDGRYITCTPSLRAALCHLRQRGQLVVWADALCINQKDDAEKSKQVALMGSIYMKASRVVVDIGLSCLKENHRACRVFPPMVVKMLALTGRVLKAVRPERPTLDPREYAKFGIPSYGHQAWSGWRAMRSMAWFTRSWIVQEVAAAKEVTVLYNGNSYDWGDLTMANQVTGNEQVDLKAYIGKMNITNIGQLHEAGAVLPKLLDLVTTFRSLDATDPKDKIYAFRGLASDGELSPLPDYSKTSEEVYLHYAMYFVKQGLGLELLADAGLGRSKRPLPSWVPDWSMSSSWQTFNFSNKSSWVSLNGMKGRERTTRGEVALCTEDPKALVASGAIFDEISSLGSSVSNTFDYNESAEVAQRIDQEIIEIYAKTKELTTTEGSDEAKNLSSIQVTFLGGAAGQFNPLSDFYKISTILSGKKPGVENEVSVAAFDKTLRERLSNRRFCITEKGHMGLFPSMVEKGDKIVWFKGAKAPMVLRKNGVGYSLLGDAFIHGLNEAGSDTGIDSRSDYRDIMLF